MNQREANNRLQGNAMSQTLSFPENLSDFNSYIRFRFLEYQEFSSNPSRQGSGRGTSVQLFVPAQPSDQLSVEYDPDVLVLKSLVTGARSATGNVVRGEFGAAANDVAGAGGAAIVRRMLDGISGEASNALGTSTGLTPNPAMEYAFKNMNHRSFQFSFIMVPTSRAEAVAAENIVKAFKEAAAPGESGARSSITGLPYFLKYPDVMIAEYKSNMKMHRFNPSVIKSVGATYNPLSTGTWSQHEDGYPAGIQLDIEFEEINIITKELVREGY